jgi:glycosyltransferase involved in cell wall biosynthesis
VRLLFFIGGLGTGGAERQFTQIASGLALRGHEVLMATLYPGGQNWDWLKEKNTVKLYHFFDRKPNSKLEIAWQINQSSKLLKELVFRKKVSIVYSALYLSNLIAWFAVRKLKETSQVWGIRSSNMKLNWKRNIPFHICSWVSSSVPMIIANSNAGLAFHESKGYQAKQHITIHNGIDTNRYYFDAAGRHRVRSEFNVKNKEYLIGLVSRIDPMKGHPTFLKAAAKASHEINNLRFICVGGGPKKYYDELKKLASDLGLDSSLYWAGERLDTPAVYSALDIATLPSSYGEGFPNIVGEAMACSIPCVVTDVGDSSYVLGDTGFVVEPGNPDKLSEAWIRLLGLNIHERIDMGEKARERIESQFTINSAVIATEKALLQLAERTGSY